MPLAARQGMHAIENGQNDGPSIPTPHRGENPGHEGPEGEPVGQDDAMTDETAGRVAEKPSRPDLGKGAVIPEHDAPDGNPIDPRVF